MRLLICFPMVLIMAVAASCASTDGPESEHHHNEHDDDDDDHSGHGHDNHEKASGNDDHEGHDHGEGAKTAFDRGHQARIAKRQCEHAVFILDCDDCRYEVGAVEVASSLLDAGQDNLLHIKRVVGQNQPQLLPLNGEVAFDERRVAHVSPRVGGVVREVFVTLGDRIDTRARLIVMDSLELGKLRSQYLQARARNDLAQKNYDREQRLHERRIASGREKLQAESTLREAKIELSAAREQLRLLGLSGRGLDASKAGHARGGATVLTAPVGGTVVAMHAVNGERVSPEESVITIADLSKVWVWADVYERDLGALLTASNNTKLRAVVEVAAFPGQRFVGTVDYVGAVMEEATRTVKVRVEVANEERLLRPGMFAQVDVELGEGTKALIVPAETVVEHEDRSFVFVKIAPRRFLRRDVTARPAGDGRVALVDGVDEGEVVVVRGAFLLKSDVLREQMGAGCAH